MPGIDVLGTHWRLLLGSLALLGSTLAAAQPPSEPIFSAVVGGTVNSLDMRINLQVAAKHLTMPTGEARVASLYILAKSPAGSWYGHNGKRWVAKGSGPMPAHYTNSLPREPYSAKVLNRFDLTSFGAYENTQFFVGYGADENDMWAQKTYRVVYVATSRANFQGMSAADTDPAIRHNPGAHHLYRDCIDGCVDDQKLFVFLPGSGGSVLDHQKIAQVIGETGVRVIVLAYQNEPSLQSVCSKRADPHTCYREARRDRVDGASASPHVASPADGIKNRLLQALRYLEARHPGRWRQYYSDDQPRFEKIIVGGFSQGAGMATWIGKRNLTARICQFSGTWDHVNRQSADWLRDASVTPAAKFYGFTHRNDSVQNGSLLLNGNWIALDMGSGPPSLLPALSGQKVHSDDPDVNCAPAVFGHACSAVDHATPLDANGNPKFAEAWKYLCGR